MQPQLSVIIVNYNVEYFLEQCLNSVETAIRNIDAEVFVVDNNSVDGSVQMVKDKFPWVYLIANNDNPGFSKANNQAIKIAKGKYILLLNPDTIVEEDTFEKSIRFMEEHEDCGGLGIKMIDGKGHFLPESKRGLPTPQAAFYKIFGLAKIFPKSKKFGRYHLGFLDKNETHEIEVLSGAYMFMRKEALDKVGMLDETFFMYGEDIDLSYRLILGGYNNYYFPGTQIVHYKGESTKKGSVNYVFVFYNAMIIFAKKHFSEKNAKTFSFMINLAIYFRASLAIVNRLIKKIALPIVDLGISYGLLYAVTHYYQIYQDKVFPAHIVWWLLLVYALIWQISTIFSGGYDKPLKGIAVFKGIAAGTLITLAIYGLLPKEVQFSRVIVLLGSITTLLSYFISRLMFHVANFNGYRFSKQQHNTFAIVGKSDEIERVKGILNQYTVNPEIITISPEDESSEGFDLHLNQLEDSIRLRKIEEVIFCARDITAQQTMRVMGGLAENHNVDFKIAQPESLFLIGSNSIHTSGDVYFMEINNINKANNKRNKRVVDLCVGILALVLSPILWLVQKHKGSFFKDVFLVIVGKNTLVGYDASTEQQLPKIKPSVLEITNESTEPNLETRKKLNVIYAKEYTPLTDLKIVLKNWRSL